MVGAMSQKLSVNNSEWINHTFQGFIKNYNKESDEG